MKFTRTFIGISTVLSVLVHLDLSALPSAPFLTFQGVALLAMNAFAWIAGAAFLDHKAEVGLGACLWLANVLIMSVCKRVASDSLVGIFMTTLLFICATPFALFYSIHLEASGVIFFAFVVIFIAFLLRVSVTLAVKHLLAKRHVAFLVRLKPHYPKLGTVMSALPCVLCVILFLWWRYWPVAV